MSKEIQEKIEIYNQKSYCDYFNAKARGFTRELRNLENCENFCTFTQEESMKQQKQMLSVKNPNSNNKNVIYIHIPFCATKCEFCPYYVEAYNKDKVKVYLEKLEAEIDYMKETTYAKSTIFECLYFGGGTPSILNTKEIERLIKKVFNSFAFSPGGEFTFESNAATLTREKIAILKESGINRISLGIQTFNDRLLHEMNCAHTKKMAISIINMILQHDLTLNIDLMFGLINQTEEEIIEDIQELCQFEKLGQITYFPFRIMADTDMEKLLFDSQKSSLDEHFHNLCRLDQVINENMITSHFNRELSPIFYHRKYVEEHKYLSTGTRVLGLGAGAGTMIDVGEYHNHDNIDLYMNSIEKWKLGGDSAAPLSEEQNYQRYILFSIIYLNRSTFNFKEVISNNFYQYFNKPIGDRYIKVMNDLLRLRFIEISKDKIFFTKRMWHILSQVKIGMPSII